MPQQIDQIGSGHTWIIEIRPDFGFEARIVLDLFVNRDFEMLVLNRQCGMVEPLSPDKAWTTRTSLFALRP